MRPVCGRIDGGTKLKLLPAIHLPDRDEAIFAVDGMMDYQASVRSGSRRPHLNLQVVAGGPGKADIVTAVRTAALRSPGVGNAVTAGALQMEKIAIAPPANANNSVIIRRITDGRKEAAP